MTQPICTYCWKCCKTYGTNVLVSECCHAPVKEIDHPTQAPIGDHMPMTGSGGGDGPTLRERLASMCTSPQDTMSPRPILDAGEAFDVKMEKFKRRTERLTTAREILCSMLSGLLTQDVQVVSWDRVTETAVEAADALIAAIDSPPQT